MFESMNDAELVGAIATRARASASAEAEKYAAIAEFQLRRRLGNEERQLWMCDDWDATAAEVAAALNIGHGRACSELDLAVMLRDRFPRVAALFAQGLLTARRIWLIEQRTTLVTDADAITALDAAIAERITAWGPLTEYMLTQSLDTLVDPDPDPDAVRRAKDKLRTREFTVGTKHESGTTPVWGRLSSTDAAIVKERIDSMARGVCRDDPRTLPQRRADALAAACAGSPHLACLCGRSECPAADDDGRASSIVIHVLADQDTVTAATEIAAGAATEGGASTAAGREPASTAAVGHASSAAGPGPASTAAEDGAHTAAGPNHAESPETRAEMTGPTTVERDTAEPETEVPQPVSSHRNAAAVIAGHGIVPAPLLSELISHGAKVKPMPTPAESAGSGYRPSAALDEYVRLRDMTCRAVGCDRPAVHGDIDHTIPYPTGPTAPWNLKCYCRIHHLIKTFWPGWSDRQLSDGTVVITTPTGHSYATRPGLAAFFPTIVNGTPASPGGPEPPADPVESEPWRTLKMPRRKRTRAQSRADRIGAERAANAAERDTAAPY